jgi:hypothetical protein
VCVLVRCRAIAIAIAMIEEARSIDVMCCMNDRWEQFLLEQRLVLAVVKRWNEKSDVE